MDPEKINLQIGGRHGDGLTFPWGISSYLNQHNIESHIYYMGFLTKPQRLEWLKKKKLIMGTCNRDDCTSGWAHYVTILGYKDNILHKYDSYFSTDENGEAIGNSSAEADYIINLSETVKLFMVCQHIWQYPINLNRLTSPSCVSRIPLAGGCHQSILKC